MKLTLMPRVARVVAVLGLLIWGASGPVVRAQGFKVIHSCTAADELPNTLIQAPMPDGHFYGTSQGGGIGFGSVFKMDTSGNVSTLHSFGGPPNDGKGPRRALYLNSDGFLYGTTYTGGASDAGTVFKIMPDSTNYSLHSQANDMYGVAPDASFFKANDDHLYLPMSSGGPPLGGYGTIVSVDSGLNETQVTYFPAFGGAEEEIGHVVQGSDNKLYGTSDVGYAPSMWGAVYRVNLGGGAPEIVHQFMGQDGTNPQAPLMLASDGNFYGTTYELLDAHGTGLLTGTIFRLAPDGTFTTMHVFNATDGRHPVSGLIQATDNNLYGATSAGGVAELGVIYRMDLSGNYAALAAVGDVGIGDAPTSELVEGLDGKLYGTTILGGVNALGSIFTIDLTQTIASMAPNSGPAAGGTPVAIAGSGFVPGATVTIGGVSATGVGVPDAAHVTATTPANNPGTLDNVKLILPDTTVIIFNSGWMSDFLDVPTGDIFHDFVRKVLAAGITAGCGGGNYCRNNPVRRDQMAVFLLKAEHGSSYVPPTCTSIFPDVPCPGTFTNWVEQLAAESITGGCGGGLYCPASSVTRQQMAVFLLKTEHGSSYVPPACVGIFSDVGCGSAFAAWIEQLFNEGVTGGCATSPLRYCPASPVIRGQMAVFLAKTFDLP